MTVKVSMLDVHGYGVDSRKIPKYWERPKIAVIVLKEPGSIRPIVGLKISENFNFLLS